MKITEVRVLAGRTFNHPHEDYSNLKPSVVLTATVEEGEDAAEATRKLQAQAEGLVEDHKQSLLKSIEDLYQLSNAQARLIGLARSLKSAQDEIQTIRKQWPELKQCQIEDGGER